MSRYDEERKKREVIFGGIRARRQATLEEAARELNAAFVDLCEQLVRVQMRFVQRVNDAWRGR